MISLSIIYIDSNSQQVRKSALTSLKATVAMFNTQNRATVGLGAVYKEKERGMNTLISHVATFCALNLAKVATFN